MIGPSIPEHLLKNTGKNEAEIDISLSDDEDQDIGPQIPSHLLQKKKSEQSTISTNVKNTDETDASIGPQIPAHLLKKKNSDEINISDDEDQADIGPQIPNTVVGPQVPKYIEEEENPDDFAPALPPELLEQRQQQQQQQQQGGGRRRRPVGPSFPTGPTPQYNDDDIVGPSLPSDYNPEADAKYSAIQAIEERARQTEENIKQKKNEKNKVERPEWMLVPPEVDYLKQANSLKGRQFTNKSISKEELASSGWTDTPAERERKLQENQSGKRKAAVVEDPVYSAAEAERRRNVQEYNRQTRPLSLLEMHQQQKKKGKKSGAEDVRKRAFDREKDLLGARPMDKKQKKELLKQSNELSNSFGYGRSSFL